MKWYAFTKETAGLHTVEPEERDLCVTIFRECLEGAPELTDEQVLKGMMGLLAHGFIEIRFAMKKDGTLVVAHRLPFAHEPGRA